MSPRVPTKAAVLRDFAQVVSQRRVDELKELGHDLLEAHREGAYIIDERDKRYLDCFTSAGIFNLGRRPPEIVQALREAMADPDQGNFPMISREKAALAVRLADFVPGKPECSVFSVMRGEAFDFACKLARGYTRRAELLAPDGSWFGQTGFALSLSRHPRAADFAPLTPETRIVDAQDPAAFLAAITERTAAVLLEPIQAENHCRTLPPDAWPALRQRCTETGALLIIDETQTGLGRTGTRFAYERSLIEPDAVILGEALGAGVFPIAATVFTQEINGFMNEHPLIHLSTFGGSDLGCVVAARVLDLTVRLRPWENAERQGALIAGGLEKLAKGRRGISTAGRGLLFSLRLSAAAKAKKCCRLLAERGVLAVPGLVATETVVFRPALTITEADAELLLQAVGAALKELG